MPALSPTGLFGRIEWLGIMPDRAQGVRSVSVSEIEAVFDGLVGDAHGGAFRPSCSRVKAVYSRGTRIRNARQLTILSLEELDRIARIMEVPHVDPAWVGASMVVSGIADLSHVPPSSRLRAASGATLVVDMENRPCHLPAKVIDEDAEGFGRRFKAAAQGLRGVTAWVECPGALRRGDGLELFVPDQPAWLGAGRAPDAGAGDAG